MEVKDPTSDKLLVSGRFKYSGSKTRVDFDYERKGKQRNIVKDVSFGNNLINPELFHSESDTFRTRHQTNTTDNYDQHSKPSNRCFVSKANSKIFTMNFSWKPFTKSRETIILCLALLLFIYPERSTGQHLRQKQQYYRPKVLPYNGHHFEHRGQHFDGAAANRRTIDLSHADRSGGTDPARTVGGGRLQSNATDKELAAAATGTKCEYFDRRCNVQVRNRLFLQISGALNIK